MATKSKAYRAALEKIEPGKFYAPSEAVAVVRETGSKRFDSTVEVAIKRGVEILKNGGVCLIDVHIEPGEERGAASTGHRAT